MSAPTREAEEALSALVALRQRLNAHTERKDALMAERIACYRAARAAGLSFAKIAAAAGVTDAAVLRALQRDDEAASASADAG